MTHLGIDGVTTFRTDEEKKAVYAAMQDVYLTDSKESVHEAYEAAIDELYYSSSAADPTENELHFYEVASYYKLNLTEFKKLARKIQLAICDEFADTQMSEEINASIIKIKLNELILLQSDENFADYYGNQMIAFDGYAVRKSSYPGLLSPLGRRGRMHFRILPLFIVKILKIYS